MYKVVYCGLIKDNEMENVKENSIVQINENGGDGWVGCLVQVSELKTWGVQGWVQIPKGGQAHIRLRWDEIDHIGESALIIQSA